LKAHFFFAQDLNNLCVVDDNFHGPKRNPSNSPQNFLLDFPFLIFLMRFGAIIFLARGAINLLWKFTLWGL
jgi:hypothetical protein